MAWVYVIQNSEGRFYIGMTTDLEERLLNHNNGVSEHRAIDSCLRTGNRRDHTSVKDC